MTQVTTEEATRFLEHAIRNWNVGGRLTKEDVADVADALTHFIRTRAVSPVEAAAPDMLEAGCAAVKWLAISDDPRAAKDLDALEAAIARARGVQS